MRRLVAILLGLTCTMLLVSPVTAATKTVRFTANVWVDNWFELYVNGKRVGMDTVPFATERSFNAETISFSATYPLTIGLVVRDYVENASGLEYIGKPNQQIGDGGAILQIIESASKRLVTATDRTWKAYVVNTAPTNPECVSSVTPLTDCLSITRTMPKTWLSPDYNAAAWSPASEYSEAAVGVKDGYLGITWAPSARLVWSKDLRLDNTVLLRKRVLAAPTTSTVRNAALQTFAIDSSAFTNGMLPNTATCDGGGTPPALWWGTPPVGTVSQLVLMDGEPGPPRPGETVVAHYYWVLYNLPATARSTSGGTVGMNFKDRSPGYTPPCSQGSGEKIYRIRVFALDRALDLAPTAANGDAVLAAIAGHTLATAELSVKYTRP